MRAHRIYRAILFSLCFVLPLFMNSPAWSGTAGNVYLKGSTSGTVTITPQATAGTPTLTLPNTSGTFAVNATSPLALAPVTGTLTIGTVGISYGGTGTGTAFTQGSVVFAGSGGVYSQDNSQFFWNDTTHRLGIGTAAPQSVLEVYNGEVQIGSSGASCAAINAGALRFSGTTLYFCNGSAWTASSAGGSASAAGSPAQVQFNGGSATLAADSGFTYTSGTQTLYVAGKIGIGTASPAVPLDIRNTLSSSSSSVALFNSGWYSLVYGNGSATAYPGAYSKVTATANTSLINSIDASLGWTDTPGSNVSAVQASGVHGVATNESSVAGNFVLALVGEAFNTGNAAYVEGVDSFVESDSGTIASSGGGTLGAGIFESVLGGGTTENISGSDFAPIVVGGTVSEDMDGIYIEPDIYGGTVATRSGIFIATGAGAPAGSDYGIYQESTTVVNYFGGGMMIGTTQNMGAGTINVSGNFYVNGISVSAGGGSSASATGVTGQVQFNGGGGNFGTDATISWDASHHWLGIGTSKPYYDLHVWDTYNPSIQNFNNPDAPPILTLGRTLGNALNTGGSINFEFSWQGPGYYTQSRIVSFDGGDLGGNLAFYTKPSDGNWSSVPGGSGAAPIGTSDTSKERMIITSDGWVGIGTTNPLGFLDVESDTSEKTLLNAGKVGIGTNNPQGWLDVESQTFNFILLNGGNVGIGTTLPGSALQVNGGAAIGYSASTSAPTNGLAVNGHVQIEGITSTGATGTGNFVFSAGPTLTGATTVAALSATGLGAGASSGHSVICATGTSGTVTFTYGASASTCNTSSRRYKHDIGTLPASAGLAEVRALNPVSFYYNDDKKNARQYEGFIAEEVDAIDPRPVEHDNEGRANALDYTQLIPVNTKAIQEIDAAFHAENTGREAAPAIVSRYQGAKAPAVAIDAAGNVGVGTTSPAYLLHVGSVSALGIVEELQNSSGACTHNPGTSSETVSCSSDVRLKKDIIDTADVLPGFDDMRVRDFTVRATGERRTGVIAQEMKDQHPDMVHMGSNGFYTVDEPNPWKVVRAIQQLDAQMHEVKMDLALPHGNDTSATPATGLDGRDIVLVILGGGMVAMGGMLWSMRRELNRMQRGRRRW